MRVELRCRAVASFACLIVLGACGPTQGSDLSASQEPGRPLPSGTAILSEGTEEPQLLIPSASPSPGVPSQTGAAAEAQESPAPLPADDQASWTSTSPDGSWMAKGYDTFYSGELVAYAVDGSAEWWVRYDSWEPFGWFEGILRPVGWPYDRGSFMFRLVPSIDGFVPFMSGAWVNQLDLGNGVVTVVLPPAEHGFYSFTLSPDGKQLVYVPPGPRPKKLVLRDVANGRERSSILPERYIAAGGILWSPDGKYLLVSVATGGSWEDVLYSVIRVDVTTLQQMLLVKDFPQGLRSEEWLDENTVLLSDWEGNVHTLDIRDSTFRVVATATRYP